MKTSKVELSIEGRPIRGYDWKLTRVFGIGTYARIAGPTEESDDEYFPFEEYSDPENRERWDAMTDEECADIVYRVIKLETDSEFWESAKNVMTAPRDSDRFPVKLRKERPDAIRFRQYRNKETGETRKTIEIEI